MITGIIFSKNRACQLDMLLRTMPTNIDIHVIYKATDEEFENGYKKLIQSHDVRFHKEENLKNDILKIIVGSPNCYVSFFVDDMVWYRENGEQSIENMLAYMQRTVNTLCFSLRLGINTNYMYQYNKEIEIPQTYSNCLNNIIQWPYLNIPINNNFGYPYSLDGHVFDKDMIFNKLTKISFLNPNHLESSLMQHHLKKPVTFKPLMASFNKSVMFNAPINRVQNAYTNKAGDKPSYDPRRLNNEFLSGLRLYLGANFDPESIRGCHQETELQVL